MPFAWLLGATTSLQVILFTITQGAGKQGDATTLIHHQGIISPLGGI